MKKIYLYTSLYPFSKGAESFLGAELKVAASMDCSITLIPMRKDSYVRDLPEGISIDHSLCDASVWRKMKAFFKIFSLMIQREVLRENQFPKKLSYWKDYFKYLYCTAMVYEDVKRKACQNEACLFYSYWLSYPPIAFSLYKKAFPNAPHRFISRGHGSDVYTTDIGVFLPLRHFMMQNVDEVFTVSDYGMNYLRGKFPEQAGKIQLSRLGVFDNYIEKENADSTIRLVSCAFVSPIKRIHLLFQSIREYALVHSSSKIEWTHIGGGELFESLKNSIQKQASLPNLVIRLKGEMTNGEILKEYRSVKYDCFVSVSSTEGIPVSMMEAISSGIPILSTDVGGVKEIVTKESGVLIPKDFQQKEFDNALDQIMTDRIRLSQSAYAFYKKHYDAVKNYTNFYQQITE